jgi:hypothetical protein
MTTIAEVLQNALNKRDIPAFTACGGESVIVPHMVSADAVKEAVAHLPFPVSVTMASTFDHLVKLEE